MEEILLSDRAPKMTLCSIRKLWKTSGKGGSARNPRPNQALKLSYGARVHPSQLCRAWEAPPWGSSVATALELQIGDAWGFVLMPSWSRSSASPRLAEQPGHPGSLPCGFLRFKLFCVKALFKTRTLAKAVLNLFEEFRSILSLPESSMRLGGGRKCREYEACSEWTPSLELTPSSIS